MVKVVVFSFFPAPAPKSFQNHENEDDDCVVRGNDSGIKVSPETEENGKYSGLGVPVHRRE